MSKILQKVPSSRWLIPINKTRTDVSRSCGGSSIFIKSFWVMSIQTKKTTLSRLYDVIWYGKKFHKYSSSEIDQTQWCIISPCDANVIKIGIVDQEWMVIGKHGRRISITEIYPQKHEKFIWYQYLSLYLSPSKRHFFVMPEDGYLTVESVRNGKAKIPWIIGLERLRISVLNQLIKKNASISCFIKTHKDILGLIALGSLNVNWIHIDHNHQRVKKGEKIGHFLLGSGILLFIPPNYHINVDIWDDLIIGQKIAVPDD